MRTRKLLEAEITPEQKVKGFNIAAKELNTHLFDAATAADRARMRAKDLGFDDSVDHDLKKIEAGIDQLRTLMHNARWYRGT